MSVFNPQIPNEQEPSYLHLSKGIEQPTFKSALGEAAKGAGDIFENALKYSDEVISTKAKEDARNTSEAERNIYTSALQTVGAIQAQTPVAPSNQSVQQTGPDSLNLLSDTATTATPDGLRRLPNQISALKGANASGKISETDYYGRLATLASDVRGRYPIAYRDMIDSEFEKVTGVNPANAYIRGMISDLNKGAANLQTQTDHVLAKLREGHNLGIPDANLMYNDIVSGRKTAQDGINFLAPPMARLYKQEQEKADRESFQGDNAVIKAKYDQDADSMVNSKMSDQLHAVTAQAGLKTFQDIQQQLIDINSGKQPPLTSQEYETIAQHLTAIRQRYVAAAVSAASETDNSNRSFNGIVGNKEMQAKIEAGAGPIDTLIKNIRDKDGMMAYRTLNLVKGFEQDTKYRILSDRKVGDTLLKADQLNKLLGPTMFAKWFERKALSKLEANWDALSDDLTHDITAPPGSTTAPVKVPTVTAALEEINRLQVTPGGAQGAKKVTNNLLDTVVNVMNEPSTPLSTKQQVLAKTFGPGNDGLLNTIKPDVISRNPDGTTTRKAGQLSAWENFADPKFVDSVKRYADPQTKAYYMDWMKTQWETKLFNQDLRELRNISFGDENGPWNISYEDGQFKLNINNEQEVNMMRKWTGRRDGPVPYVSQLINKINGGLSGMKNIAALTDRDPSTYVLQSLMNAIGPGGENGPEGNTTTKTAGTTGYDLTKIKGIPEEMVKAIQAAKLRDAKPAPAKTEPAPIEQSVREFLGDAIGMRGRKEQERAAKGIRGLKTQPSE